MPLILFPNLLGSTALEEDAFSPGMVQAIASIQGLIAESEKEARHFLRRFRTTLPIQLLNEHTTDMNSLLEPLLREETWGLISDAGLPCLADPGADLVFQANQKGISVKSFPGPCSITLALQLSGLSGQRFTFHGYLSRDPSELNLYLKMLPRGFTNVCIEAPYRNQKLFQSILSVLPSTALVCVASDLTLPTQEVHTHSISAWKKRSLPEIQKRPSIFLIFLGS